MPSPKKSKPPEKKTPRKKAPKPKPLPPDSVELPPAATLLAIIKDVMFAEKLEDRRLARQLLADAFVAVEDTESAQFTRNGKTLVIVYRREDEGLADDGHGGVEDLMSDQSQEIRYYSLDAREGIEAALDGHDDYHGHDLHESMAAAVTAVRKEFVEAETCPECGAGSADTCSESQLCCSCCLELCQYNHIECTAQECKEYIAERLGDDKDEEIEFEGDDDGDD